MNVLVSGSTGFVGSALVTHLTQNKHTCSRLDRSKLEQGTLGPSDLEGFEAIVHLAGENIASGRWTAAKKQRIRESRVRGTQLIAKAILALPRPPQAFICASAIGYYGNRGAEVLREGSPAGTGFLAEVCRFWEAAATPAQGKTRVVNLRFGMILSAHGGALTKMLTPFKLGVGGKIGPGNQFMSWITLDDVVQVIGYALKTPSLLGPVNVVAPNPVTNLEFTKALGRTLSRPTIFPMPALAARLAFGEMADDLLLASQRVEPAKLVQSSYPFLYPELEFALRHLLK